MTERERCAHVNSLVYGETAGRSTCRYIAKALNSTSFIRPQLRHCFLQEFFQAALGVRCTLVFALSYYVSSLFVLWTRLFSTLECKLLEDWDHV